MSNLPVDLENIKISFHIFDVIPTSMQEDITSKAPTKFKEMKNSLLETDLSKYDSVDNKKKVPKWKTKTLKKMNIEKNACEYLQHGFSIQQPQNIEFRTTKGEKTTDTNKLERTKKGKGMLINPNNLGCLIKVDESIFSEVKILLDVVNGISSKKCINNFLDQN